MDKKLRFYHLMARASIINKSCDSNKFNQERRQTKLKTSHDNSACFEVPSLQSPCLIALHEISFHRFMLFQLLTASTSLHASFPYALLGSPGFQLVYVEVLPSAQAKAPPVDTRLYPIQAQFLAIHPQGDVIRDEKALKRAAF